MNHTERKENMKIGNVGWRCCAVMVLAILCGCETITVPPEPPTGPNPPKTDKGIQLYDLESATSKLMSDMLSSHAFKRHYADVKETKGNRPVVVVGKIGLLMHANRLDTEVVRDGVQTSLNEAHLFTVKEDGFYDAPDYLVTGNIKSDVAGDGSDANPRLHLKILDINSGKIIWFGTQYDIKL